MSASASEGCCGKHSLWCAANSHINVDSGLLARGCHYATDIPITDEHNSGANFSAFSDNFIMPGPIEHAGDQITYLNAFGFC